MERKPEELVDLGRRNNNKTKIMFNKIYLSLDQEERQFRRQPEEYEPFFLLFDLEGNFSFCVRDNEGAHILATLSESQCSRKVVPQIGLPVSMEHSVPVEVTDVLENLTQSLNRLCTNVESVNVTETSKQVFSVFKNEVLKVLPIMTVSLLLLCSVIQKGDNRTRAILVSILGALKLATSDVARGYIDKVLDHFHKFSGKIRPQGLEDYGALSQAFVSMCLFLSTSVKPHANFTFNLIDRITHLGKVRQNFMSGLDSILSVLHDLCLYLKMDYLASVLNPVPLATLEGLESWVKDCDQIMMAHHGGKFEVNRDNYDHLHSIILRGMHLIAESRSKGVYDKIRTTTTTYLATIRKISVIFEQANFGRGQFRPEPLTILFKGAPGVGKSAATAFFLNDIMKQVLPPIEKESFMNHPTDYIYMRKNEHKFWDGYHGQFCTVFDDFGQQKDFAQNLESEYMDLIRVCNTFPHICHMASLENKGNVEFRSKIVLLTTNMEMMMVESLNEVEAALRRVDIMVRVAPTLEHSKNGETDPRKRRLELDTVQGVFDEHIYEMHLIDPITNSPTGQIFTYSQLVDYCVAKYHNKHRFSEDYTTELRKRLVQPQGLFDEYGSVEDIVISDSQTDEYDIILSKIYRYAETPIVAWPKPILIDFLRYIVAHDKKAYDFLLAADETNFAIVYSKILKSDLYSAYIQETRQGMSVGTIMKKAKDTFELLHRMIREASSKYPILSSIIAVTSVATAAAGFYRLVAPTPVESQTHSGQEPRVRPRDKPRPRRLGHLTKPQMGSEQSSQMVNSIVSRNVYEVITMDNNVVIGNLLVINDRTCLYPKHFNTRLRSILANGQRRELTSIELCNDLSGYKYVVPIEAFLNIIPNSELDALDCCVVILPDTFRRHRDISRNFAKESDVIRLKQPHLRLSLLAENMVNSIIVRANPECNRRVWDTAGHYTVVRGFEYKAPTRSGDCGAILTLENTGPSSGKIVGFHIAGNAGDQGISNLVLYEDVEALLGPMQAQMGGLDDFSGFEYLGVADPATNVPGHTKIVPSRLHSSYAPSLTKPAYLRSVHVGGNLVNPMVNAVSKYKFIPMNTEQMMYDAIDQVFSRLEHAGSDNRKAYCSTLSFEETVLGIPSLSFVDPMPRNTSPGYPYNCSGSTYKGKTYWLGQDGDVDLNTERGKELLGLASDVEKEILAGRRFDFFFSDFLKDERRSLAKVDQGKTRLVSGSPIVLTMLTRKYFSGFSAWVMSNHIRNGSAVGINVYSDSWDILARKLDSFGGNIICGDFSNFDGSLRPEYLRYIGLKIDQWYDDGNSGIRQRLWQEVWNSKHVNGSVMYQWKQGLPSGHPLTSIINSIYNMAAITFVYNTVMLDIPQPYLPEEHMWCIVYGDDNCIALSSEVIEFFNPDLLVKSFLKIGLKYTPPSKETGFLHFGTIEESTFLKRSFRFDAQYNRYLAPLELSVILETPMWTRKGALRDEITYSNVEDALHELSLHCRDIFEHWSGEILKASLDKLDYHPLVVGYHQLKQRVLARKDIW